MQVHLVSVKVGVVRGRHTEDVDKDKLHLTHWGKMETIPILLLNQLYGVVTLRRETTSYFSLGRKMEILPYILHPTVNNCVCIDVCIKKKKQPHSNCLDGKINFQIN